MYSVSRKNCENRAACEQQGLPTFDPAQRAQLEDPERQQRRLRAKLDHDERDHESDRACEQDDRRPRRPSRAGARVIA